MPLFSRRPLALSALWLIRSWFDYLYSFDFIVYSQKYLYSLKYFLIHEKCHLDPCPAEVVSAINELSVLAVHRHPSLLRSDSRCRSRLFSQPFFGVNFNHFTLYRTKKLDPLKNKKNINFSYQTNSLFDSLLQLSS